MKTERLLTSALSALLVIAAGANPMESRAAEFDISNLPLIVSVWTPPNVFLTVDDSGSMNWEILALQHFSLCAYDGFASDRAYFTGNTTSGNVKSYCAAPSDDLPAGDARMLTWSFSETDTSNSNLNRPRIRRDAAFIFDFDNNSSCNNSNNVERCEGKMNRPGDADTGDLDMDWRIRSSALNVVYFNPTSIYTPWVGGSTTYANANWNSARSWPDSNASDYSKTRDLDGFHYNVWIDDKGYGGAKPTMSNMTGSSNNEVDLWDSYVRVTVTDSGESCEKFTITSATNLGMDADKTSVSCTGYTGGLSGAALRQNIANWFQYYRRRVHVANAGMGQVLTNEQDFRYGLGYISAFDVDTEMPDVDVTDYSTHITTMLDSLFETKRATGQTPLRGGLDTAGKYYSGDISGTESPITLACQKNFTVLFTDGYWDDDTGLDDDNDLNPIGDADGDGKLIYGNQALQGTLLADVAKYYYDNDLRTDMENLVPTDSFDSANYQHMVTYTINFGSQGLLSDLDGNGWPGSGVVPDNFDWYSNAVTSNTNPTYWDPRKADDMWHAAWNSRGTFIGANSPAALIEAFAEALRNIDSRVGSAAAAGANSGSISSDSKIFQAKFDTSDWHGELLAFPVNTDGSLAASPLWSANTQLTDKSNFELGSNAGGRNVFTFDSSGGNFGATAFEWSSISAAQKALLNTDAEGNTDTLGENRLEYVRGVDSGEEENGGTFRSRRNKLGDIVNSDPTFIGFPPFFYPFDNYQAFFTDHVTRTGMVYFGANDGMFHAVRESDGEELFAYVPEHILWKLPLLADPEYAHEFYVDGQPEYGDVQINGDWKTIISSGLRAAGQALFALDVTDPTSFAEENVLWEFSDKDDADLGYTYSQPQIKRMANDKWAVIIGNGINNTEQDGYASTTGTGALYILFIEDGIDGWSSSDFVKITVPGGGVSNPNALFTPAAADIDGDNVVDFIYAGDRNGKMWKFDVTSATTTDWGIAFNGNALFDAGVDHAITDRPAIAAHPMGRSLGQLVTFGTGQYIELSDTAVENQPTQTIYSIWDLSSGLANDHTAYGYSRADLSAAEFTVDSGVRVMGSGTPVDWLDVDNEPNERGWYVDLPEEGERIRRRPILRDDLIFFVTLVPDEDPCAAGGVGWIMVLDTQTGLAPKFPVFDINNDQTITDSGDQIPQGGGNDPLVPVGIRSASIPNLPAIIYDDRPGFSGDTGVFPPEPNASRGCDAGNARAYTFTTQSNGSIMAVVTATENLSCGRQSWLNPR